MKTVKQLAAELVQAKKDKDHLIEQANKLANQ